ncbi:uncharacterized protein LOC103522259 [Diaphorina citri]|uniref:Uncharacterized protein LOC103522259 n=1 Tax=Diaphorina citri TaxID=121845 RepID=A0A3Q0JIV3_DIACI|nr:uncharacterized protein LOC103522259 [Diaphorina citri]
MNRVKEIKSLSNGIEWRHIPGTLNPADLPSRGSNAKKFIQSRWWEGPSWLKESQENWPVSNTNFDEEEINAERKKTVVSSMMILDKQVNLSWYNFFSQFTKLVRMVGWMMRFVTNVRYKKSNGCLPVPGDLTADEFAKAENKVLLWVQKEAFNGLNDPRLDTLCPFIDESGLIRIKTKISNRVDDINFCEPIVLPKDHDVVKRLIIHEHRMNAHAGAQTLLAICRKRFWILGGRQFIKSVLNTCITCKRHSGKNAQVVPTPLPEARVRDARVFEVTGVDLAGPLYVKSENGEARKVWVCLFTCAVYRAVRLELVSSLSTNTFLQALRRFCSRQGRPSIIYSDNATNFVGFDNVCAEIDWSKVASYSSVQRIDWRFIPPSSPWWGGWWERMIGVLKNLLRKILGHTSVDCEELSTILCECEAVINSRPLTYMSNTASDLTCISPSMFLQDIEQVGVPEFDVINSSDLSRKLKHVKELRRQLCERFRLEYLGQLQLFTTKKKEHKLEVGDMVLIGDDNTKRINWPLGRIVKLIAGADNHVRVVQLRTKNGILTRPVQRVYPLEINYFSPEEMTPTVDRFVQSLPEAERSLPEQSLPDDVSEVNSENGCLPKPTVKGPLPTQR